MKSNVFDENGEQTHVLLDMEEYESLQNALAKLENIRHFAQGMLGQLGDVANSTDTDEEPAGEEPAAEETFEEERRHSWG